MVRDRPLTDRQRRLLAAAHSLASRPGYATLGRSARLRANDLAQAMRLDPSQVRGIVERLRARRLWPYAPLEDLRPLNPKPREDRDQTDLEKRLESARRYKALLGGDIIPDVELALLLGDDPNDAIGRGIRLHHFQLLQHSRRTAGLPIPEAVEVEEWKVEGNGHARITEDAETPWHELASMHDYAGC